MNASEFQVGDISARVVPHPDDPMIVLCCGQEWSGDRYLSGHLLAEHYTVTRYTDDEKSNALVPIFLEAPNG